MGSVLQLRWPTPPSFGEGVSLLFVQAVVGVAPLSALLLAAIASDVSYVRDTPRLLQAYAAAEVLFYGFYRLRLAQLSPYALPPNPLSLSERRQAIDRAYGTSRDMKRFLSGWFKFSRFEDIWYDNALEWLAWSMFGTYIEAIPSEYQDELVSYVREFEGHVGQKFPPGYNEALRNGCIRINLDPVSARHRPVISYIVTYTAHAVGWACLRRMGFLYAQAGELSYWYRCPPPDSVTPATAGPPVVLLHGIGLGLVPYLGFLSRLKHRHGDTSTIICPEFPHIAQRFFPSPPSKGATTAAIRTMLCRHCPLTPERHAATATKKRSDESSSATSRSPSPAGARGLAGAAGGDGSVEPTPACFIGHSFGSVVISWQVTNAPECVGSMLMLDPVTFLLQEPDVAHNFLYREPEKGSVVQAFFKYFVATELHIANTLARDKHRENSPKRPFSPQHRHFWWHENVLWLEDLPARLQRPEIFKVMLAGGDEIVNVALVAEHLEKFRPNSNPDDAPRGHGGRSNGGGGGKKGRGGMVAEVVIKDGLDHAEVVVSSDAMETALDLLAASMQQL